MQQREQGRTATVDLVNSPAADESLAFQAPVRRLHEEHGAVEMERGSSDDNDDDDDFDDFGSCQEGGSSDYDFVMDD